MTADRDKELLANTFAAMLTVNPQYFQIRLIGAGAHGLELVRVDQDGDRLVRVQTTDLQEKAHYPTFSAHCNWVGVGLFVRHHH